MRLTRRAAIGSLALLAAGCGRDASTPSDGAPVDGAGPAPDLHVLAEQYVRLTLKLAQHQKPLVETWLGPKDWLPGAREPVGVIRDGIERLQADLRAAGTGAIGRQLEQQRLRYLQGQVQGLLTAARRLLGESITFTQEATLAYGIDPMTGIDARAAAARDALARALPGSGPLVDRLVRFQRANAVPRARLERTLAAAVDACRTATTAMIPLPEGETATLGLQDGLGLEGWAVYQGDLRTRVLIEGKAPFDVAHLLWLAAHETYPGHHLQYVLADRDLVRAHDWQERQLHVSFGPHLLYSEGLAETGADLLLEGDAFARMCRDVLVPAAGVSPSTVDRLVAVRRALTELGAAAIPIAAAYLDEGLTTEPAAARLREEAVVPEPEAFLMMAEKLRIRILAYPLGKAVTTLPSASTDPWSTLADAATYLTAPTAGD